MNLMAFDNTRIEMNVEQWRRDVKTFVATTMTELDEITRQLACEVADPSSHATLPTSQSLENSDERLSRLKHKLSQRS